MDDVLGALAEQHRELDGLLGDLDETGWGAVSRCTGWSVADVVLHLAQTDAMAVGSLRGDFAGVLAELTAGLPPAVDVDEGVAMMVAAARGATGREVREQWRSTAAELRAAFAETDPRERVVWVAGTLSARTLATTRLAECWIHTGDVAEGLGVVLTPAPRLVHVAHLAWRTLPYAFARGGTTLSGPVEFDLGGPQGERWRFVPDDPPVTVVRGDGAELCAVAGRRIEPSQTGLSADGPDGTKVLELVRTYA